jgi:RNA polymerase sigma-70 factor (ECF subfamily)
VPRYPDYASADLVRACVRSSDGGAWEEFIRRFQPVIAGAVLRTARQWVEPSRTQLDDLIQDTYLKLCENNSNLLTSFQPRHEDSIYGYLRVVAANVVHDHFKGALAAKRGSGLAHLESDNVDTCAADADGFESVARRIQLERVDDVLRQITVGKDQDKKRTIFWLRYRQGFTAREIASIPSFGLTTEGVESMLLRLVVMIRSHLQSSQPHRDVKVLKRQNRSNKQGT